MCYRDDRKADVSMCYGLSVHPKFFNYFRTSSLLDILD